MAGGGTIGFILDCPAGLAERWVKADKFMIRFLGVVDDYDR